MGIEEQARGVAGPNKGLRHKIESVFQRNQTAFVTTSSTSSSRVIVVPHFRPHRILCLPSCQSKDHRTRLWQMELGELIKVAGAVTFCSRFPDKPGWPVAV